MDFLLMRDVYHCPPSVLDEQDENRVRIDAWILAQTLDFQSVQSKRAAQGRK